MNNFNNYNNYTIYTRGIYNPITNEGRWAATITSGEKILKMIRGTESKANITNKNRMELIAIANSLSFFSKFEGINITILCDSQFIANSINLGWYKKWIEKGWIRYKNKPVLNIDVWKYIVDSLSKHDIAINWLQCFSETEIGEKTEQLIVRKGK